MSIATPEGLLKVPQLTVINDAPTRLTAELLHLANIVWQEPGVILSTRNLDTSRTQKVEHRTKAGVKLEVKQTIISTAYDTGVRSGNLDDTEIKIGFTEDGDEMDLTLRALKLHEYDYVGDPFVGLIMDYFREHVDTPTI